MEDIGKRIKQLRDALSKDKKMSQADFGKRVGLSQTGVANIENGCNNPSNAAIMAICHEFNVNETWLRTGEGEMFRPLTRTNEIAAFIGKTLSGDDNIKQRLIWALSQLDENEWKLLEQIAKSMVSKENTEKEKTEPE